MKGLEIKSKVKQVLTWRWTHQPKDTDELDHTHSPQKQVSCLQYNSKLTLILVALD